MKLAVALLGLLAVAAAGAAPTRIASLNLCTDSMLLELVGPERIASVTYLAADEHLSYFADRTRGLHLNHGQAEEILSLRPDLVLAGTFTARPTTALLEKLGLRVMVFDPATDLSTFERNFRRLATEIGERERADALLARMNARILAARPGVDAWQPRVVVYQASGFTLGRQTLADDIMRAAGLENVAPELGLYRTGHLPLERLIMADPDLLILPARAAGSASQAHELLSHPALERLARRDHERGARARIAIEDRLWSCAGTYVAEAVELLRGVRDSLGPGSSGT